MNNPGLIKEKTGETELERALRKRRERTAQNRGIPMDRDAQEAEEDAALSGS